jgi:hypothetical protein
MYNQLKWPLSPVQQGMFFHYLYDRNRNYLEQMICDIAGDFDVRLFEETLNNLIDQYDSLRTLFLYDKAEGMRQLVLAGKKVMLDYRDIAHLPAPYAYIEEQIVLEADHHFNLEKQTCRSILFRTGINKYVFLCTYHHLIMDSWTIRLLMERFCHTYLQLYAGLTVNTTERYSYKLYLDWIERQNIGKAQQYWKDYLEQYTANMEGNPVGIYDVKRRQTVKVKFGREVREMLDAAAAYCKTTVNTLVLAVWGIYIMDFLQTERSLIGCVTLGRIIPLKNVDKIAGLFVNSIPLYLDANRSLSGFVQQVQQDLFRAAPYSYMLLSDIMSSVNLRPTDISCFVNFSIDTEELDSSLALKLPFSVSNIRYNEQANYEVYLDIYLGADSLDINIYFDELKYRFVSSDISEKITDILKGILKHPDKQVRTLLNDHGVSDEVLGDELNFSF